MVGQIPHFFIGQDVAWIEWFILVHEWFIGCQEAFFCTDWSDCRKYTNWFAQGFFCCSDPKKRKKKKFFCFSVIAYSST